MSARAILVGSFVLGLAVWAPGPIGADTPAFNGTKASGSFWGISDFHGGPFATGTRGRIAVSDGTTWTSRTEPGRPLLLSAAAGGAALFAAGAPKGFSDGNALILRSEDSGESFSPAEITGGGLTLYEIGFRTADEGYAAGAGGTLLKTTDNGKTWDRIPTGTDQHLWAVRFLDSRTGLIAGGATPWQNNKQSSGLIRRTTDGGRSWTTVFEGPKRISDMAFLDDSRTGFAAGVGGVLFKTTDAGVTWAEAGQTPLKVIVNALGFVDETCGVAVGAGGTAYVTTDGGKTWPHAVTVTDGSFLEDLSPSGEAGFLVAGGDGTLGTIDVGRFCRNG